MGNKESYTKKQEILQLSINLIGKEGLSSVSFRKLANSSGYTVGSIQNFFKSQENFYIEILDYIEFCAIQRAENLELFQNSVSLEDFILYSEQLLPLDNIRKMELMAWTALVSLSNVYPKIQQKSQDLLLKNYDSMEKAIDLMKVANIFAANLDTPIFSNIYYSFLEGLSQHSFVMPQKYPCNHMKELNQFFITENFLAKKE